MLIRKDAIVPLAMTLMMGSLCLGRSPQRRSADDDYVKPPLVVAAASTATGGLHRFSDSAGDLPHAPRVTGGKAVRVMRFRVTAYCACPICCGKSSDGITACGKSVRANSSVFVATNTPLPFDTKVWVPGYNGGQAVPVWDRMADSKEPRIDVFFRSHYRAKLWGVRWLDVKVQLPG